MKHILFVALVGSTLLFTACQSGPTPTPTETATSEPMTTPFVVPTQPPRVTPTSEPSSTPVATSTPAATPTLAPADVWVNSANGLNLRAEAKADAKVVAILKNKQHLVAIAPASAPDAGGVAWQNVRSDDGQVGWVSAQYLTKTNPAGPTTAATAAATAAAPTASTSEAWVNSANGLNLRAQASTTAALVVVLPFGTHLTLISAPKGPDASGITWQNVRTDDGKTGFVSTQFLSTTKPSTPTPSAAAPANATATIAASAPATTTTTSGTVYVIAVNGLNLRAQPNTTAAVVAQLKYGQRLTALAPKTAPDAGGVAWQNVRTDASQTGWAAAEFLSASPPVTSTATTPVASTATTPVASTAPPAGVADSAAANDILRRVNELRAANKLNPVIWNAQLAAAALQHSQDMAKTSNISDIGSDGSTFAQRAQAAGYTGGIGQEALYGGRASVDDAWFFWTNDRTSANTLLTREFTVAGIAVVNAGDRSYYTVAFGKP